jgi:hypothetical protein
MTTTREGDLPPIYERGGFFLEVQSVLSEEIKCFVLIEDKPTGDNR